MSAVLNVLRGPVALRRGVVTLVEQWSKALRTSALLLSSIVWLISILRSRPVSHGWGLLGRFTAVDEVGRTRDE
jgi:hypothetical protein